MQATHLDFLLQATVFKDETTPLHPAPASLICQSHRRTISQNQRFSTRLHAGTVRIRIPLRINLDRLNSTTRRPRTLTNPGNPSPKFTSLPSSTLSQRNTRKGNHRSGANGTSGRIKYTPKIAGLRRTRPMPKFIGHEKGFSRGLPAKDNSTMQRDAFGRHGQWTKRYCKHQL